MADTSGQADIRSLDIQKLTVAYEEEARIFKNFVRNATTSAREIRWFQDTQGISDSTDTSGVTGTQIGFQAHLGLPEVVQRTVTRNTDYVKKFFVSSEIISHEDIKDSDVDIFAMHLRDLVISVEDQVDKRIWDVLSESQSATNINSVTSTAAWDAASGQDPIEDIEEAKQLIREQTKRPIKNGVLFVSAKGAKDLMVWLISTKGSAIPQFASDKVGVGVITDFLGLRVVVSENVTDDYALVADAASACAWKSFMPIKAITVEHGLRGIHIEVAEEGEAILERPKFVTLISNTET